jgi:hypothetical protein
VARGATRVGLKEKGIVRLPNPAFTKPDTAPAQADDGKDRYS